METRLHRRRFRAPSADGAPRRCGTGWLSAEFAPGWLAHCRAAVAPRQRCHLVTMLPRRLETGEEFVPATTTAVPNGCGTSTATLRCRRGRADCMQAYWSASRRNGSRCAELLASRKAELPRIRRVI